MTPTEFATAMALELRAAMDEERRANAEIIDRLRAEVADLRAQIKAMPHGPPGAIGPQGERGPEGLSGRDGRDAPPIPGPRGEAGQPGKDGRDGSDGKDGITEERFVAALTEQVAAMEERVLKTIAERKIVPYKGVHQSGAEYQRGDFVTFGGSLWHCDKTTTTKPEQANSDWTLAVKHGRDGRDR